MVLNFSFDALSYHVNSICQEGGGRLFALKAAYICVRSELIMLQG